MFGFSWKAWLRRLPLLTRQRGRRNSPNRCHPHLDTLESRVVLSCTSPDPFICKPLPNEFFTVHIHPRLSIVVNGVQQEIPAQTGIPPNPDGSPSGSYPLHTHDSTGTVHVESSIQRDFHLIDFFGVWGQKFDRTHILDFQTAANNPITMTVGGVANTQLGNLLIYSQTSHVNLDAVQIVITATNAVQIPLAPDFFAVGGNGRVQVRKTGDGSLLADFQPFGASYTGGVSVAVGDVTKDGTVDLVVSTVDGSSQVKVYDGTFFTRGVFNSSTPDAFLMTSFNAIDPSFHVGITVAVGDVLGDGFADIVTGAVAGNPDVRVFSGKDIAHSYTGHQPSLFNPTGSSLITQFFAYGLQFNVGANVAVGDLSKNGFADIVTGASSGNPHVKVYSGKAIANHTFQPNPEKNVIAQFFAYGLQFNIGATVAVGDTNGDGAPDLITGASAGNPHVRVFDGNAIARGTFNPNNAAASELNFFFAYGLQFNIGADIGAADIENNGKFDILTGASRGTPHYRIVKGNATGIQPPSVKGIEGIPTDLQGGVFVSG